VEAAHRGHDPVTVSGYRKEEEYYCKADRRNKTIRYINGVRIESSK